MAKFMGFFSSKISALSLNKKYLNSIFFIPRMYCCHMANTLGTDSGPILGLRPANERWRYFVTTSLIGWAQA